MLVDHFSPSFQSCIPCVLLSAQKETCPNHYTSRSEIGFSHLSLGTAAIVMSGLNAMKKMLYFYITFFSILCIFLRYGITTKLISECREYIS